MPRMKVSVTPVSEAISRRFFEAVEALVNLNRINSLSGFCEKHDLSAPRYREMRLSYGVNPKPGYDGRYKNVEIEALHALVSYYRVSGSWLLAGVGSMFSL